MYTIKKLFPISFRANSLKDFLVALVIYIVLDFACGLVIGLLGKLPLIGMIFGLVGTVLGVYFLIGMVLTILVFLHVIK